VEAVRSDRLPVPQPTPSAATILLFEPSGTVNTGNVANAKFTAPTGIVI
jgi:hypothetical protein